MEKPQNNKKNIKPNKIKNIKLQQIKASFVLNNTTTIQEINTLHNYTSSRLHSFTFHFENTVIFFSFFNGTCTFIHWSVAPN